MKDTLLTLEDTAESALAAACGFAMYRAFARRHGVMGLPQVPTKKTHDATDAEKAAVVAARARRSSDANWLLLGRDPVCVEFDLTGDQVAGILAEATRKANEAAAAAIASPADCAAPANWPPRIHVLNGGTASEPPAKGHVERTANDVDKDAIIAARVQIREGVAWDAFRQAYGAHRRLTTQQIAKVVADHTRAPQSTQPVAQA